MGRVLLKDNKSTIEVIAGEYNGTKGPATTFSPVSLFNAKLNQGSWQISVSVIKTIQECLLLRER